MQEMPGPGKARTVMISPHVSESRIQKQIADILTIRGIVFCRSRFDKRTTIAKGWPDFTLAINGTPIALEVKGETGKLSDAQKACHEGMKRNGWRVYVVRSIAEAVDILNHYLRL